MKFAMALILMLLLSCCIETPGDLNTAQEGLKLSGKNGYFDVIGKSMQVIGDESSVDLVHFACSRIIR